MDIRVLGRHGAMRRRDLVKKVGRYQVRAAHANGELVELWSRVVVDACRATQVSTRAAAALLAGGDRSAITGATAAQLHGFGALPGLPVHLVVPYGHPLRTQAGLVVHNHRGYEDDVDVVEELRVLHLDAVLVDLLCSARPADALAVLDQAMAARPVDERDRVRLRLFERLSRRHDPRGTRRGKRVTELSTGLALSPPESKLLWAFVEAGLPTPQVNWPIHGMNGDVLRLLDLCWPELRIVVEYDGYAAHFGREEDDAARQRDLERRGWTVIRVTAEDMRDLSTVISRVRMVMVARGCA